MNMATSRHGNGTLDVVQILDDLERLAPAGRAQRNLTAEAVGLLSSVGFFRAMLPAKFGGLECHPVDFFKAAMQVAERDMSSAWICAVVGIHPFQVALMGESALQEVYGSNPNTIVSSTYNPMGAKATAADGGVMLSGRWAWSSGSLHAEWLLLGCIAPGENLIYTCLVPKKDYVIEDTWFSMGLQGSGSNDVVISEPVFVPFSRIHKQTDGFLGLNDQPNKMYSIPWAQLFAATVAVPSIGAAKHALRLYIANKNASSIDVAKMQGDPDVARRVAEVDTLIDNAESSVMRNINKLVDMVNAGQEIPMLERARIRYQTGSIVQNMIDAVDLLFAVAGGRSVYSGSAIQNIWLDIRMTHAHIANNPVPLARNYGNMMLGLENTNFFM